MAIVDLQRRIQEAGRIRIGQQVASGNKSRPAKLDTFRLTSADHRRIAQAAELYGGTPARWQAPSGQQWEVVTEVDALDVIVPPSDLSFSQHYETWSQGGCQRRCDGVREQLTEGPCLCDPDNRECAIHTRLSVMLRDLSGLGVWRIDTSGYYAAVELQGAVEVIQAAAGRGTLLPARLRLEQRSVKRQVDGKPQTRNFPVPVLDVEITPAQLLGPHTPGAKQLADPGEQPTQVEPSSSAPLTPVPESVPERPARSIADQAAAPEPKPKRKNAAPEIPASGRDRRGAASAPEPEPEPEPAGWERDDEQTGPEPITQAQMRKLQATFAQHDLSDRDTRLRVCSSLVERELSSAKDLTKSEASTLIDSLEQLASTGDLPTVVAELLDQQGAQT